MNKQENSKLMSLAEQALRDKTWTCPLFKDKERTIIYGSYDGQIAALGVSILMIGLRPTISVYYQDEPVKSDAYRRGVLEVIARMMKGKYSFSDAKSMTRYILDPLRTEMQLKELKTLVLNYAIALKQVARTYEFDKKQK